MIAQAKKTSCQKNFYWKVTFDRVIAAILVIPGLPIMIFLGILIRLTSKGPALFMQTRVGKGGKLFTLYKLRSMTIGAESETGPTWAKENDPRVTWLGHYLRKFHLDEFPQLFNVLRGEMSLVGPRPERPEFVEILKKKIHDYADRLHALPGITGLAQINLPADSDLNSVQRKQNLDLEYIHKANPWLDLRVFLCTFGRLVKFPEPILLKLFALKRNPEELQTFHPYGGALWNVPHELNVSENIVYERITPPISPIEKSQSL